MIELKHLTKTFQSDGMVTEAVRDISLTIEQGDIFGIIGLSGAGKSTLVRCINFLEKPTSGQVIFEGVDLGTLSHRQLLKKRQSMSMIFQGFNLLSQRTVLKNVCYPLEITGVRGKRAAEKAGALLELVGLSEKKAAYPSQLSGGQKQRVAIARALATDPKVLLCDEATSALDPNTTMSILELLKDINRTMGVTIVIITHEMKVVQQICNRVAVVDGGSVVETGQVEEVFLAPKSKTARDMIFPQGDPIALKSDGPILRLVFDGQSALEPVISNLTLACQAPVNILGADTKNLGGKAFGQIIIQLPDHEASIAQMKDYLKNSGIHFEEEGRP